MDYTESYQEYLKQARKCFVFDLSKIIADIYYSEESFINVEEDRLLHEFQPDAFYYKLFNGREAIEAERIRYRQTTGAVIQFFFMSLKSLIVDQVPVQITINNFAYTKPMDFLTEAGELVYEGKQFNLPLQALWKRLEDTVEGYSWHHTHIVVKRGLLLVKFEGDKRICDWYEERISNSISDGD